MNYRTQITNRKTPSNWGLLFITLLLLPLAGLAQRHFDFNAQCKEAYRQIIQLKLDAGQKLLDEEKRRDPANLIPDFLESYIDFFILFFNEDPSQYQARKDMLEKRIEWMSEGPESSPFYLFTRSVLHFQSAAIEIKFGNHWSAGWEFRRSFLQSKEAQRKFPSFQPALMLSGAMQVVAGTIPDGYKWLSSLLGIKGTLSAGMQQLEHFLSSNDPWAALFHDEAVFYYLYLKFYIENKHAEVFSFIRQNKLDVVHNYLYAYLAANLSINNQQAADAEQIIRGRSDSPGYMEMPVWDLEMGYVRLFHLEPDAHVYLERYTHNFKGKFYIKDALQKISWSYYLQGDMAKAEAFRQETLRKGGTDADADKQALKEAKSGRWPDKTLLKARLLCDGGYYGEALPLLQGKTGAELRLPEEKCELAYRMGRIYDGLGRWNEALSAYQTTIRIGAEMKEYFAARAALQAGYICEQRGDKTGAINFFEKCLSLKDHDYKNSLDQRAKAGIERCKGE